MGEIRDITGMLAKTQFAEVKATLVEQLQILIEVLQSDRQELLEAANPAEVAQALQPLAETLTEASQSWRVGSPAPNEALNALTRLYAYLRPVIR